MPFDTIWDGYVRRYTVLAPPDWMSVFELTGAGLPMLVFVWPGRDADLDVSDGAGGIIRLEEGSPRGSGALGALRSQPTDSTFGLLGELSTAYGSREPAFLPGCAAQRFGSGDLVPFVVYGGATLDVTQLDATWEYLSGVAPTVSHAHADVDHDTYDDLVMLYPADQVAANLGAPTPVWLYLAVRASNEWRVARLWIPYSYYGPVDTSPADGIDDSCTCTVNTTNAHVVCP